ncbi:MAG: LysM peptidoglycan-binding domain-containing protein [Pseudohongiellaceae bacterium]
MYKYAVVARLLGLILLLPGAFPLWAQENDHFPRPPELEPAVQFWIRVYTEVDTQSGFLHDSQHLSVIYRHLPLDRTGIETNRKQIQDDLSVLASGRRTNLTASQKAILDLWPTGVTNATLAQAVPNVRWQLGQSDRFLAGLQRSGAYRSHINQVIREKNLPLELGVLPHVESSFNPNAFSSASAAGMWQFGASTGQRFMRIDHIVDERMDPYTATYAAMSLLEYNYSILGTWPLALTAYNHGAGGMSRAIRELGTDRIERIVADYKGRAFGFASRNFYAQFLAVVDVENNARRYFGDLHLDPAPEFVEVTTDAYIDAEVFASAIGISLEQLRADNRALRPVVWDGSKRIPKDFTIKVRRSAVRDSGALLAMISADQKFTVQTPDVSYVVVRGDSLSVIADRFDTSVSRLVSLNQLPSSNRIQIGQRLLLPQDSPAPQTLLASVSTPSEPVTVPADGLYNVRRGDTVSLIAARFSVAEAELLQVNQLRDPHLIYPGQQLALPGSPAASSVTAINAADVPRPPVELSYTGESVDIASPGVRDEPVSIQEVTAPQLALVDAILPPAAVLPDDQELQLPSRPDNDDAVAVDVHLTLEQNNERLADALSVDPSDYSVASNGSIEIQASETLGHYADWLGLRAWDIRRLNNMAYTEPVITGKRLRLDFSTVNANDFEVRRREYHLQLQQEFFSQYRIQDVETYRVSANDNIGSIARIRYSTPLWLLRQYNPELDFNRVQIGQEVVFPLLEPAG